MSNLITSMWTGVSGMTAAQNALNMTAHNIANIDSKGYTRQQLLQVDTNYNTIGYAHNGSKLNVGIGTTASTARALRNQFFDRTYRTEAGREAFYDSQYEIVNEIEDLLGELEGVQFQTSIQNMWSSLEELSKEPESIVTRATFVNQANEFIQRATEIQDQIKKYQVDLNTRIIEETNRINELGKEIYELNKQIVSIESAKVERANDLRDARNLALDELATYAAIEYAEEIDGAVQVYVEGQLFVTDLNMNELEVRENEASSMVDPYWVTTGEPLYSMEKLASTNARTDIGSLRGLLLARGNSPAKYTDIPIRPVQPTYPARADYMIKNAEGANVLDTEKYAQAVEAYEAEMEDYNVAMNRFNVALKTYNNTIDASTIMGVMAQLDNLVHGIVTGINDRLCPNKEITVIDEAGNETTMLVLDEDNAPVGMDDDQTMGEALFDRKAVDRYTKTTVAMLVTDDEGNTTTQIKDVYKYNEENPSSNYSLFTLGEIKINEKILNDYSKLPLSENSNGGDFSYAGTVKGMIDMWDEPFSTLTPYTLTRYTFKNYYSAMIGNLGNDGNTYRMMSENQQTMVAQIDVTRNNYAGVAQDEELSNLIKYQYSYNAASRYFNVINDMLDTLLSMFA